MRVVISTFIFSLVVLFSNNSFAASGKIQMSELHRAAFYNDVEKINRLLSEGVDINAIATNDITPLHMASYEGNLDAIKILIKKGANPDLRNDKDETALDVAIRKGKADVADYLFSVTKTNKDNTLSTPIPEKAGK